MTMLLFAKGGIGALFSGLKSLFTESQAGFEGGFWANGSALLLILIVLLVGLIVMATRLKAYFLKQTDKGLSGELYGSGSAADSRTKYASVDTFKLSGTFFNLGLALAIGLSVLAFGWSQIDAVVFIPDDALAFEDDIVQEETPRTAEPPPPPPPPPPIIEEVPDETILEDEIQTDDSADLTEKIPEKIIVKRKAPAPKPKLELPKVEEIFKVVEQMPRFPGCEDQGSEDEKKTCATKALLQFIYKNIKYPAIARENGVEGTAVITFVVEKDGTVKDARVVRDIGAQCGDEALRVVQLMNTEGIKWTPGKQRGRNVRVQFNLPVKFKLE